MVFLFCIFGIVCHFEGAQQSKNVILRERSDRRIYAINAFHQILRPAGPHEVRLSCGMTELAELTVPGSTYRPR